MSEMMTDKSEDLLRRKRLAFRAAHRGTKEMDLLFGGFVAENLDDFSAADLTELEALSDIPDNDLLDWYTGRLPVPEGNDTPLVRRMLQRRLTPKDYTNGAIRP
jgi:antitoxin CptB